MDSVTKEELVTARYNTCKICENYRRITDQCKLCGCVMFLKTKMANQICPAGKWGQIYGDN